MGPLFAGSAKASLGVTTRHVWEAIYGDKGDLPVREHTDSSRPMAVGVKTAIISDTHVFAEGEPTSQVH